ncbi:hypothetical protein ABKN59_003188 [Abortiporus biennis]
MGRRQFSCGTLHVNGVCRSYSIERRILSSPTLQLQPLSPFVKAIIMGTVTIVNETSSPIHVRVTSTGSGQQQFFDIKSSGSESWSRDDWQVAFVLRDDNGKTETRVVKPGNTYTID